MTRSKFFLYFLLSFIGGVASGSFFDISQKFVLISVIISLSLIAIFYRRGSRILNPTLFLIALVIIGFSGGFLLYDNSESKSKILTNFNDQDVNLILLGYINGEPQKLIDKQRFTLQVKEIRVEKYITFPREKVLVITFLYPEFDYGDFVLVRGKIQKPKNFTGFDYENYLAKEDIFSVSYYPKIEKIDLSKFFRKKEISFFEKIKIAVFKKIFEVKKIFEESIGKSIAEPNASFIKGILLGSKANIPKDLKESFNKTNTSHILAISGYNITIIANYLFLLFLIFFKRQTAFWFVVSGILFFVILTGASSSVIRAGIMGILVLIAYQSGRFYSMTNSIVFAAALMILFNPKILRFDLGFQLSFLATLGLIYISPLLEKKFERIPRLWTFKENFIATLSAQIMVFPLILFNFKNFSLLSLPANILILPFIPMTMFFGFISGILGLIWEIFGQIGGIIAWLLSSYEIILIKKFSSIQFLSKSISVGWQFVLIFYLIIGFFIYRFKRKEEIYF